MTRGTQLTRRQREVLNFVQLRSVDQGAPPTLLEIAEHFGFKSLNAAREHVRLIERKGFLQRRAHQARGIRVVPADSSLAEVVPVPLLGRIAAGNPTDALENVEVRLPLPRALLRGGNLFALRVQGNSMEGVGIVDGDIAIVSGAAEAANGEIAAVVISEDATLKRIFRTPTGIRLHPENPSHSDLIFDRTAAANVRVAGVLVGIFRVV
jgi:repressor LexA